MNRIVDAVPKQYRGLFDYSVVKVEGKLQMEFKARNRIETDIKWLKDKLLIPLNV